MLTMAQATVAMTTAQATWTRSGVENTITLKIVNTSTLPAVACRLLLTRTTAMTGIRILPVHFNDNYFSLAPGDTQSITVQFDEVDRAGTTPQLCLTGVNVPQTCFPIGTPSTRRGTVTDQEIQKMYVSVAGSKLRVYRIPDRSVWQVALFDMQGRTILEAAGIAKGTTAAVSTSRLRPGAYVVTVAAAGKQLRSLVIVPGH
jgi:hypothetical protein